MHERGVQNSECIRTHDEFFREKSAGFSVSCQDSANSLQNGECEKYGLVSFEPYGGRFGRHLEGGFIGTISGDFPTSDSMRIITRKRHEEEL